MREQRAVAAVGGGGWMSHHGTYRVEGAVCAERVAGLPTIHSNARLNMALPRQVPAAPWLSAGVLKGGSACSSGSNWATLHIRSVVCSPVLLAMLRAVHS